MSSTTTTLEVELTTLTPDPSESQLHFNLTSQETVPNITSQPIPLSKAKSFSLMATLSGISFLNTFNSGLLTVALPAIAKDLHLASNLLLWPASVYALTLGCTLLLFGTIADVIGNRPVYLLGNFLHAVFTLACSLSQTGTQLVAFRALQGVAMAGCLPTSVSIITKTFPRGQSRNFAFAAFGGGNPIGFASGLVLGGLLVQVSGWRSGYYLAAGLNAVIFITAVFVLPCSPPLENLWNKLAERLDWIGVILISSSLALLSYVFASITYSTSELKSPLNISLLVLSILLLPAFIFWERRQEKLAPPALIPTSIWSNTQFTTICLTVFLTWGWFNAFGYWSSLYFQNIQLLSPLQTSLRFLPLVVVGFGTNIVASILMNKVTAFTIVAICGVLSAAAPAMFGAMDDRWMYWMIAFPAMCLSPISSDILFNVSNLVITATFPSKDQALAGGIFNTVTQLGNSVGLAVTAIVASSVQGGGKGEEDILRGYRAAYWTCLAAALVSCGVGLRAFKDAGKVGLKKD